MKIQSYFVRKLPFEHSKIVFSLIINCVVGVSEINDDNEDQPISDTPTTQLIVNENTILLCAKVTFRT